MSIPVLSVPVMNRPELLRQMLASIDVPVERYIIIDNSPDGNMAEGIDLPNLTVIAAHSNFGVAGSWNLAIKSAPLAPWWAFVNNDITFMPGDLGRLIEHMGNQGGMGMLLTPSAFAVTADCVEKAGYFDENFYPAYFEDNDYVYRCGLTGVTVTALPANYAHERSATILSDGDYMRENARTFPLNQGHYSAKWGGPPLQETYKTPFNAGGSPRDWSLEHNRHANLVWKK